MFAKQAGATKTAEIKSRGLNSASIITLKKNQSSSSSYAPYYTAVLCFNPASGGRQVFAHGVSLGYIRSNFNKLTAHHMPQTKVNAVIHSSSGFRDSILCFLAHYL